MGSLRLELAGDQAGDRHRIAQRALAARLGRGSLDEGVEALDEAVGDGRTAATGMARAGVSPHVVERILNHVTETFGGVAGVYIRFQYLDEMRSALQVWERHVAALRGTGHAADAKPG